MKRRATRGATAWKSSEWINLALQDSIHDSIPTDQYASCRGSPTSWWSSPSALAPHFLSVRCSLYIWRHWCGSFSLLTVSLCTFQLWSLQKTFVSFRGLFWSPFLLLSLLLNIKPSLIGKTGNLPTPKSVPIYASHCRF